MRVLINGNLYVSEETGVTPSTTGLGEHPVGQANDIVVVTAPPSYHHPRRSPEHRLMRIGIWEVLGGVECRGSAGTYPPAVHAVRSHRRPSDELVRQDLFQVKKWSLSLNLPVLLPTIPGGV